VLTGTIEFNGQSLSDVELAIDEAKRRILDEFRSGHDRNESGSFSFSVEGEAEEPR